MLATSLGLVPFGIHKLHVYSTLIYFHQAFTYLWGKFLSNHHLFNTLFVYLLLEFINIIFLHKYLFFCTNNISCFPFKRKHNIKNNTQIADYHLNFCMNTHFIWARSNIHSVFYFVMFAWPPVIEPFVNIPWVTFNAMVILYHAIMTFFC